MPMDIVVASGKGGVGKSLVTSSLLYVLRDKYSVIGLDADAPAPNLHLIFGVEDWEYVEDYAGGEVAEISPEKCIKCNICVDKCIYDAIVPASGESIPIIRDYLCEGCRACGYSCPVNAITYREILSGVLRRTTTSYGFPLISAKLDVGRPNSGKLVADERKWAREMAGDDTVTFIDSAAGIGCEAIASMSGASAAILVAEPTEASVSDMARAYGIASHFGVKSYIVVNKSSINPGFGGIERFARENNIDIIGTIPYDDSIPHSARMRKPLLEAYPDSSASGALRDVASAVEEIIENSGLLK